MARLRGIDSKLEDEILKRIEKSKNPYSKKDQRAELIIRNERFQKDFSTFFDKYGLLIKPTQEKGLKFALESLREFFEKRGIDTDDFVVAALTKFGEFCTRWGFRSDWTGTFDSIGDYIRSWPQIVVDSTSVAMAEGEVDFNEVSDLERESTAAAHGYLYLKIDPWTIIEDIKNLWPKIQRLQKSVFGYKSEKKSLFGRDLCWYDLRKRFKLSVGQIAGLWIKHCPRDIELIVIKTFRKTNESRIRKSLGQRAAIFDGFPKLLDMIKEGRLGDELRKAFEDDAKLYAKGEYELGGRTRKATPRFLDLIKSSIKQIEIYIKQAGGPVEPRKITWPPYQPIEDPAEKEYMDEIADLARKYDASKY